MRLIQTLGVAAQAESLRLRREVRGTARQAAWIAAASLFGVAAVVTIHLAAIAYLAPQQGLAVAAGIVAVADLVIAGIFLLLARRRVDPVAEEARALRVATLASLTRRDPLRGVLGMALRSGSAPVLGAVAAEAISAWLKRR